MLRVNPAPCRGCHDETTLRHDVAAILGGRGRSSGDNDIAANLTHNTVDRGIQTQGLIDDHIQDRQILQLLENRGAKGTVGFAKVFNLFLVELFARSHEKMLATLQSQQGPTRYLDDPQSGELPRCLLSSLYIVQP